MDTPPPALWRRLLLPAAVICILAVVALAQRPDGRLHIYVLATPGDAALIQTPAGRFALIDGGGDPANLTLLLGRVLPFWRRDLRATLLTSPSGQRLPGQVAALARYRPDLALTVADLGTGGFAGEWRRLVAAAERTPTALVAGQRVTLDGATLTVLGARAGDEGGAVLLLTYGATRVLFHTGGPTGDADALRAARAPLDLLVYPWQRALDTKLVAALRPRAIVFSEAYMAPAPALLSYAARRRYSPTVFHPGADGQIELESDGRRAWFPNH
ncbi:MAG: hypothetical protein WCG26_16235 [Chloroflexales bacterium]